MRRPTWVCSSSCPVACLWMNGSWTTCLCRKRDTWSKRRNFTTSVYLCKKRERNNTQNGKQGPRNGQRNARQTLETKKSSSKQKTLRKGILRRSGIGGNFGPISEYNQLIPADSREASIRVFSPLASLNCSFESSEVKTQHGPFKKSLFATNLSRFANRHPKTCESGANQSQLVEWKATSNGLSTLFGSRLNTSIFNRRMIFPGEHGIFGTKVENEFLEDKTKLRRQIRKKLFAKSYIKEVDALLKDLKVAT